MFEVSAAFAGILFVLLFAIEAGYWFGRRDKSEGPNAHEPEKIAAGFVMTLLSLILAFTLSAARSHYSERAAMILKEAQAIRSARVALDDLSGDMRTVALLHLTEYVESKKEYNLALNASKDPSASYERGRRIMHEIRRICRQKTADSDPGKQRLALERAEIVAEAGLERHVLIRAPHSDVVIIFLFAISVIACLLLGHSHRGMKRRAWWAGMLFASVIAATIVIILDYDSPRLGLIRVDSSDVLYDELSRG